MRKAFGGSYEGMTVLVTGHTGFKGSWLALWLSMLGARVQGFALPPESDPAHCSLVDPGVDSVLADIGDPEAVAGAMTRFAPDIVFHLAAQPLVRRAYELPVETFRSNVLGTVHVLEAARRTPSVRAVVCVTTDKVYENPETGEPFAESDPLGGHDPYSASKAGAEIAIHSYRVSFCAGGGPPLIASARAGNVIGGGDWSEDRLVPDLVRGAISGEATLLRNPASVRPWQHVLESLAGYLALGARLLHGDAGCARAYNFGPDDEAATVASIAEGCREFWPRITYTAASSDEGPHEAAFLRLDNRRAKTELGWQPVWDNAKALEMTACWYRDYHEDGSVTSREQIERYVHEAATAGNLWAAGSG